MLLGSYARQRMLYGRTNAALASRFLREIPEEYTVKKGGYQRPQSQYGSSFDYSYRSPMDVRTSYQKPAQTRTTFTSTPTSSSTSYLELNRGDMVLHTAFGKGMVLSVVKMGGDALLEIAFDEIGTKKLMAKTASAHMKRL